METEASEQKLLMTEEKYIYLGERQYVWNPEG